MVIDGKISGAFTINPKDGFWVYGEVQRAAPELDADDYALLAETQNMARNQGWAVRPEDQVFDVDLAKTEGPITISSEDEPSGPTTHRGEDYTAVVPRFSLTEQEEMHLTLGALCRGRQNMAEVERNLEDSYVRAMAAEFQLGAE